MFHILQFVRCMAESPNSEMCVSYDPNCMSFQIIHHDVSILRSAARKQNRQPQKEKLNGGGRVF